MSSGTLTSWWCIGQVWSWWLCPGVFLSDSQSQAVTLDSKCQQPSLALAFLPGVEQTQGEGEWRGPWLSTSLWPWSWCSYGLCCFCCCTSHPETSNVRMPAHAHVQKDHSSHFTVLFLRSPVVLCLDIIRFMSDSQVWTWNVIDMSMFLYHLLKKNQWTITPSIVNTWLLPSHSAVTENKPPVHATPPACLLHSEERTQPRLCNPHFKNTKEQIACHIFLLKKFPPVLMWWLMW